jgi:hypothetical protein
MNDYRVNKSTFTTQAMYILPRSFKVPLGFSTAIGSESLYHQPRITLQRSYQTYGSVEAAGSAPSHTHLSIYSLDLKTSIEFPKNWKDSLYVHSIPSGVQQLIYVLSM